MKNNITGVVHEQFIADIAVSIAVSVVALIACSFSIMTGIIYPVQTYEQQLLNSWNIKYVYVLIALLMGTMLVTVIVSTIVCKTIKRKPSSTMTPKFSDILLSLVTLILSGIVTFWTTYVISGRIIFQTWSFYHNSTVLDFISLFTAAGFILGLAATKTVKTRNQSTG